MTLSTTSLRNELWMTLSISSCPELHWHKKQLHISATCGLQRYLAQSQPLKMAAFMVCVWLKIAWWYIIISLTLHNVTWQSQQWQIVSQIIMEILKIDVYRNSKYNIMACNRNVKKMKGKCTGLLWENEILFIFFHWIDTSVRCLIGCLHFKQQVATKRS